MSAALLLSCGKASDSTPTTPTSAKASKFIYVASGNTYAGNGVTMSTASNTVVKYDLTGTMRLVLADYTNNPGDTPVALVDYDSDNLLVAVENATNTGSRRLDLVRKDGSGYTTFLFNSAAFAAAASILQDVFPAADGGFLVSRGNSAANATIEKFTSTKARVLIGATPYVSAPAGTCATATTRFPRVVTGPSGILVMSHAAATPNNKILLVSSTGYAAAADCLVGVTAPSVNHYPTAMLYVPGNQKLLVAYSNTTGPVQEIYAYDITATTLTGGALLYKNFSVVQGVSAMTTMSDGSILLSNASSSFNTVEQFTYSASAGTLTRVGTAPVIAPSIYSRSISGIVSPAE